MKATCMIAMLAMLLASALPSGAGAKTKKPSKSSATYNAAVCACRTGVSSPQQWSECMKAKGFKAAPGSGWGIKC